MATPPRKAVMDGTQWRRFCTLHAQIENVLSKVLNQHFTLGLSEYRALCLLSTAPDQELRMQDLARELALTQSSVTRLVERLETRNLTQRDLCPDDKRGRYTVLTRKGHTQLEEAQPVYEQALCEALDAATEKPETQDAAKLLRKLQ